jgi:Acyl-protein synthetase, LuxE
MAGGAKEAWELIILTPPPAQGPNSSLLHMFETIRRQMDAGEDVYVGRLAEDGGWGIELEAAVGCLREASGTRQPVLVLGTAFSFVHLLDYVAEQGMRFTLPPGSCVLETGGYKGRSRWMAQSGLHALISQRLGIAPDHIICEYGMSELSSQAYDCVLGSRPAARQGSRCFHFPPWARVQIISPETGREVGEGETGLIRIFDLANVWSVMAIQTEDLGVRYGSGFTLAGRAALAEARGCSLMAV